MEIKGILTAKEMDNQGKKIPICNKCGNIKTCESVGLFSAPPNHTLLTYSCDCKKNRNDYYNSWENIIVRNDSITKEESRKIIADYFKSWDSISEEQAREIRLGDLTQKRNKLSRQISTLKKANLNKDEFVKPVCPDCNCSGNYVTKQDGKWWCRECNRNISPVEYGSKEHEETPSMKRLKKNKKKED